MIHICFSLSSRCNLNTLSLFGATRSHQHLETTNGNTILLLFFFLLEHARREKWSIAATHFIWYFPQQGVCVPIISCTWTVSLMLPARAWFTQHTPTMQALLEQQVGHFLETQALLHLLSADGISRMPRRPLALLIYGSSPAFRHPEVLNKCI